MHAGRMPCEEWSYATTSQGTTRSWKRGREQILPWHFQRERDPADTLISDFHPPQLWDNRFLLCKPLNVRFFVMVA